MSSNYATARILVVEDDESIRLLMNMVLKKIGCRADQAANGQEAKSMVDLTSETPPLDLLVTDVNLAGGSGFDLVRFFRQLWPSLRVLYISGYPHEELEMDENTRLLLKPFGGDNFIKTVQEMLQ